MDSQSQQQQQELKFIKDINMVRDFLQKIKNIRKQRESGQTIMMETLFLN